MSLTSTVYPSATGSRFEHSLGTMHLARLACESIFANSREASRKLLRCIGDEYPGIGAADTEHVVQDAVGAVGLTHDLGHPPFSHALETDFGRLARGWFTNLPMPYEETGTAFHEIATHHLLGAVVIADLSDESGSFRADLDDGEWQRYSAFLDLVLRIATADPDQPDWAGTLHGIVAGELDVDRLDYIMRDAQRAGTEYGSIDHYRLLQNMELAITDERSPAFSGAPAVAVGSVRAR